MNVKRALITTTVHTGSQLHKWAELLGGDDIIIIAGDQRSPHAELRHLAGWFEDEYGVKSVYLDPQTQGDNFSRTSQAIPWNCIQRRNLALLEALRHSPDYIVTVDDDNVPVDDDWFTRVSEILLGSDRNFTVRADESRWWDPGTLNSPYCTFRGFPIELRNRRKTPSFNAPPTLRPIGAQEWDANFDRDQWNITERPTGVFQSMILGDPDCDAIERIVRDPVVDHCIGDVICERGTWAPFNSQATVWHRDVAPLMFMWPFVGRYDDIWAAYTARAIMDPLGWHVRYGHPTVYQERNAHNVLTDLRMELLGMGHTLDVARALRIASDCVTPGVTPVQALTEVYAALKHGMLHRELKFLPSELGVAFDAWLADLSEVGAG